MKSDGISVSEKMIGSGNILIIFTFYKWLQSWPENVKYPLKFRFQGVFGTEIFFQVGYRPPPEDFTLWK